MSGTESEELARAHDRIRDLEAALKQKDRTLAVTFRLTPTLSDLFGLLVSLPNVTVEMMTQRLGITSEPKVAVSRLREKLKPWGVKIYNARHVGYWLAEEDKARVKQILTQGLEVSDDAGEDNDLKAPPPAPVEGSPRAAA